jgi:hypothetical protein
VSGALSNQQYLDHNGRAKISRSYRSYIRRGADDLPPRAGQKKLSSHRIAMDQVDLAQSPRDEPCGLKRSISRGARYDETRARGSGRHDRNWARLIS